MGIIPVKTPLLIKKLLPEYIWEFSTSKKEIYLTFDDGPTPEITHWTLDTLKSFDAKATFFCIGENVKKHPDIFNAIIDQGHTIGNHSNTHLKGWKTSLETYIEDVEKAQIVLTTEAQNKQILEKYLFRPPYGQIKPKQGKALIKLGYTIITWSILSFDWEENTSKESCLQNVIGKSKPGSIIVFHDSIKASNKLMYALPKVLEFFSEKGYSFKAL